MVFYAADVLEHPLRVEDRFHFPGNPMLRPRRAPREVGDVARVLFEEERDQED